MTGCSFRCSDICIRASSTPDYSILIQSGLAIVLFLLGDIENMLGYFTMSYALQNALMYGAIFFLRGREDYRPTYRSPFWRVMAALAILTQGVVAVGTFIAYPAGGSLRPWCLFSQDFPSISTTLPGNVNSNRHDHEVLSEW